MEIKNFKNIKRDAWKALKATDEFKDLKKKNYIYNNVENVFNDGKEFKAWKNAQDACQYTDEFKAWKNAEHNFRLSRAL